MVYLLPNENSAFNLYSSVIMIVIIAIRNKYQARDPQTLILIMGSPQQPSPPLPPLQQKKEENISIENHSYLLICRSNTIFSQLWSHYVHSMASSIIQFSQTNKSIHLEFLKESKSERWNYVVLNLMICLASLGLCLLMWATCLSDAD